MTRLGTDEKYRIRRHLDGITNGCYKLHVGVAVGCKGDPLCEKIKDKCLEMCDDPHDFTCPCSNYARNRVTLAAKALLEEDTHLDR